MSRHTLVHQLADWATRRPNVIALRQRVNDTLETRTWSQVWNEAQRVASGLIALGHKPGDRVAIVGENRIEWFILELGIMTAGGIPAPIYGTNTAEQAAFIVEDALHEQEVRIVICDNQLQLDKYREGMAKGWMTAHWIITMDDLGDASPDIITYKDLQQRGGTLHQQERRRRVERLNPEDTGLLIYTSGTTGMPKGVRMGHGAMVLVADTIMKRLPEFASGRLTFRAVSYLPLCHGAEQIVTTMGILATGGEITFCSQIAGIRDALLDTRPTMFLGVPRVWEKFEAALQARFAETTGMKRVLLDWARKVELEAIRKQAATDQVQKSLSRTLANKLVLSKLREALGFDQIYFAVTGSAPISQGTLEFFASLGVVVHEAYGLTETTGLCTIGEPGRLRFGKIGSPLAGVDVRIAEDGEIQLNGPLMTKGYWRRPEETAELFTDDGWLRTGDLGDVDPEGFVSLTGRKKELIITAGGKNIAPLEIEALLNRIEGIGQAVVVGDRKPYLAALLTVDPEALPAMAKRFGVEPEIAALAASEGFNAMVQDAIENQVNTQLARVQTVKRFKILPRELSIEAGELTPTMKLRRDPIVKLHADAIESLYD